MAANHIISTRRWSTSKFHKLPSLAHKIVLEYLKSNPMTSRSGIYTIYTGAITGALGDNLINSEETKNILIDLKSFGLIDYDPNDHVVFIKNFHLDVPFDSGRPDIVAKDLLKEFKGTAQDGSSHLVNFWMEYVADNIDGLKDLESKLRNSKNKDFNKISLKPLLDLATI